MTDRKDRQVSNSISKIEQIVSAVRSDGRYTANGIELSTRSDTSEVWVRATETGTLLAYSSMEADRDPSIIEFAADYF